ncbi:hypothetical protein BGY98DRAFT_1013232 [Russula aff. rugulosa BPL654]|nr:hypothetical protein BGY98DRAFT_1013232 [Russula aff. rugulosa BPL654]
MPSKSAARIAQTFTATDHSAKIQSDQWEEQPDLKIASRLPHFNLDFSDTREVSSWTTDFKASRFACASRSAISPCRTLTRQSSKIASSFDYTNPVYLNRLAVMGLEVRGVDKKDQGVHPPSSDSLEKLSHLLTRHNQCGPEFQSQRASS